MNPTSAAYERRASTLDDVVIVSACRTALCKAKRGSFKDTPVDDLIAAVLKDTIRRSGVEPEVSFFMASGVDCSFIWMLHLSCAYEAD